MSDQEFDVDDLRLVIEADGERDTVTIPRGLADILAEDEGSAPVIAGDIVLLSCAQRVNTVVSHAEGEVTDELLAIEARTMELFKERFGTTFEEATGFSGRDSG